MRRARILSSKEAEQLAIEILNRSKFKRLAVRREICAKAKDRAFIEEYTKLCIKYKRLIGGLSPENNITHLKTIKATKEALKFLPFRIYNRSLDNYPKVGSGWYLGSWRSNNGK
jgi:hypothetical protein